MIIRLKLAEKKRIEEIAKVLNDVLPKESWVSFREDDCVLEIHVPVAEYLKKVLRDRIAEIYLKIKEKMNVEYLDFDLEVLEW